MKADVVDLTPIFDEYKGLWVAVTDSLDTVVSSGTSAKTVYEEAKKKGYTEPTLFKVPTEDIPFFGGAIL